MEVVVPVRQYPSGTGWLSGIPLYIVSVIVWVTSRRKDLTTTRGSTSRGYKRLEGYNVASQAKAANQPGPDNYASVPTWYCGKLLTSLKGRNLYDTHDYEVDWPSPSIHRRCRM
jgi:hypothetical protein